MSHGQFRHLSNKKPELLPRDLNPKPYLNIIMAVGTNDLKSNEVNPTAAAQALYGKLKEYRRDLPNSRIILPGVLPTSSTEVNERIKLFNKHLVDITNSSVGGMVKYLDTRVFCDREGRLREKFRTVNDGPVNIHLNQEGTKLLASRIKTVLRENHFLPTGPRFRKVNSNPPDLSSNPARGRGNGRRGGRGGRGRGASRPATNSNAT